jgi:hypothetical protein
MPLLQKEKDVEMVMYAIISDHGDWWNNDCGWCGVGDATLFSAEERRTLNLPVGGRWVEVHFYT